MKTDDLIKTSILNCAQHDLYTGDHVLTDEQQREFDKLKVRYEAGEPLQYILGQWQFCGAELTCDHRALIPRPETEILIDEAVKRVASDAKILNIGVGTGNIEIALASKLSEAYITGVEVSRKSIELAQENVAKTQYAQRVNLLHQDIRFYLNRERGDFDLIISNPPYVPTNDWQKLPQDVRNEPRIALDGGCDGLDFYRLIITHAASKLNANGYLMFECGDGQHETIAKLINDQKQFGVVEFIKDLSGVVRVVIARIK